MKVIPVQEVYYALSLNFLQQSMPMSFHTYGLL